MYMCGLYMYVHVWTAYTCMCGLYMCMCGLRTCVDCICTCMCGLHVHACVDCMYMHVWTVHVHVWSVPACSMYFHCWCWGRTGGLSSHGREQRVQGCSPNLRHMRMGEQDTWQLNGYGIDVNCYSITNSENVVGFLLQRILHVCTWRWVSAHLVLGRSAWSPVQGVLTAPHTRRGTVYLSSDLLQVQFTWLNSVTQLASS